jgi:tetratricopeptide (TPR) repeat protein
VREAEVTHQGPLRRFWLIVAVPLALAARLRPSPALLRGTARAFARSGHRSRAERWARRYLDTAPTNAGAIRSLADALDAAGGPTPGITRRLGRALLEAGDPAGAVAALQRATAARPRKAKWWDELGRAHLQVPGVGHRFDPTLGLTPRRTGDPRRAADAFSRASVLAPGEGRYRRHLASALAELGELEEAVAPLGEAVEAEPHRPAHHYRLGMAILRCGAHRDLTPDERSEAAQRFEETLSLDPGHRGARRWLVRAAIEQGRWVDAWRIASRANCEGPDRDLTDRVETLLRDGPGSSDEVARLSDELAEAMAAAAAADWWLPLHCRLLSDGWFVAAYGLKRQVAASVVAMRSGDPDPLARIEVARAMLHLGDAAGAHAHLGGTNDRTTAAEVDALLAKVDADIRLLLGDPAPATEQRVLGDPANHPQANERFARLIEGRDVAVVGPADTRQTTGSEIDGFDTVIRTSHLHGTGTEADLIGSRTDVAYYASTSSGLLADGIRDALASGQLQQAVFRPSSYRDDTLYLHEPGDLRYVPSEFKAGFHGGPMAIQRILYDVLRYRPGRVKLFNVDLFVGQREYGDAYEPGMRVGERWRKVGVAAARALAHDYLLDLRLTRSFLDHGLIEADPVATRVLALSDPAYLARLDERADARPAEPIPGGGA